MFKSILATTLTLMLTSSGAIALADGYGDGLRLNAPPIGTYNSTPNYGYADPTVPSAPLQARISAIPQGTVIMIKVDQPVNSVSSRIGDPIRGLVEADVYLGSQVVIPVGSAVDGSVINVTPASKLGKPGSIGVQFYTVKPPYGANIPIRAHVVTEDSTGVLRGDTAQAQVLKGIGTAAGGAAVGTLSGTALGSLMGATGGGAVLGLAVGSLAGMGYAMVREGKQVEIPAGARMSIMLDQPAATN